MWLRSLTGYGERVVFRRLLGYGEVATRPRPLTGDGVRVIFRLLPEAIS